MTKATLLKKRSTIMTKVRKERKAGAVSWATKKARAEVNAALSKYAA